MLKCVSSGIGNSMLLCESEVHPLLKEASSMGKPFLWEYH